MGRLVVEISARDQGVARQLDQVTSRLGMIETVSNNARRENIRLRDSIIRINESIAENNRLILKADDATRQSLQAKNRALRSERELLNVQSARSRQNLAGLQQEARELRGYESATERATRGTGLLSRASAGFGTILAGAGIAVAGREIFEFARESVNAAVRVEGFRNSLTALYGDAQIANTVLADLRDLAQLPGITFEGAVEGAVRLKTVGIEGERANAVIREFGNAAALSGATTIEMTRAIVGFTQNLSRGQIEQDNLNQILENVPLIGNSIREAFGSIDAETIRDQLSAAGQGVQDFADILVNQLSMGARASADSTSNAFSNLRNATFELQAAIGEQLAPAVRTVTTGLTAFISRLAEAARGTDAFVQASMRFSASLGEAQGNTEATNTSIQAYIQRLTELRTEQEQLRDDGPWWRYRGDTDENIESLTADINLFREALDGVPGSQDRVRAAFEQARTAYQTQVATVVELTNELENNRLSAGENNDAYEDAQETLVTTRTRFQELLGTMQALGLIDLPETTDAAAEATAKLGESAGAATQVYQNFTREIDTATDEIDRWQSALESASTEAEATQAYDNLTAAYQRLFVAQRADAEQRVDGTAFYQAERENIKGLSDAEETRLNVINRLLDTEARALVEAQRARAAANAEIQRTIELYLTLEDPLRDYAAGLELTSETADRAFGEINQVGEAVRNADFERAAERLTDFDDAFQLSEATIPRVTSAMREFTGTAPDVERVTEAVEKTTRSVDDLLGSLEAVGDGSRHISELDASFLDLSERTIPRVAGDITSAFVDIAEGQEITDAFSDLGNNIGLSVVSSLSDTLADGLSDSVTSAVTNAIADEGLLTAAGSLGSTIGTGLSVALVAAVTAIPIADLIGRIINPPEANTAQEIDEFQRRQIFQPGHPLHPDTIDPTLPRTAVRDVEDIRPVSAQVGGGVQSNRRRRDVVRQRPGPGFRYNATTGQYEPIPFIDSTEGSVRPDALPEAEERVDEQERLAQELIEIQARTAARILDIRTNLAQRLEDIDRNSARDLRDLATDLSRDMRDIATELSRDLRDTETERVRDLLEIDIDLEREKRDIAISLAQDLRDIAIDLARDLRDIETERVREIRDINIDLGREIRDINMNLVREVLAINTDLAREIRDINIDLSRDLRDIDADLVRDKRDIQISLAEDIRDINTGLARDLRDINTELAHDLRDIDTDFARDIRDINTELSRDLENIETEHARDIRDINISLSRDLRDIDTDTARDRRDIAIDLGRDLEDIETSHLQTLEDAELRSSRRRLAIEQDFSDRLEDLRTRRIDDSIDSETRRQRAVEDLQTRLARRQFDATSFSDLTDEQQARLLGSDDFERGQLDIDTRFTRDRQDRQREFGILRPGSSGFDLYSERLASGQLTDETLIQRLFGSRGLEAFRTQQGAVSDEDQNLANAIADAIAATGRDTDDAQLDAIRDNEDTTREAGDKVTDAIVNAADNTDDATQNAADDTVDAQNQSADQITDAIENSTDARIDAGQDAADAIVDAEQGAADDTSDAIVNAGDKTAAAVTEAGEKVVDAEQGAVDDIADAAQSASDEIVDAQNNSADKITDANISAGDKIADANLNSADSIIDAQVTSADSIVDATQRASDNISAAILESIDSIADVNRTAAMAVVDANLRAADLVSDSITQFLDREMTTLQSREDRMFDANLIAERRLMEVNTPALIGAGQSNSQPVKVELVNPPTSRGEATSNPLQTVINNPVTVIVQLDDGTLTQVEGRLASRSDQGLSPLNV